MGESTSVTLVEVPPSNPADAPPTPPTPAPDRPAWLPEKFKSPEDMAKAYGELEGKLGKPAPKEGETKPNGLELPTPQPKPEVSPIAAATQEFAEKGELSEATYKALEAQGLTKDVVDGYIEGKRAQAARAEEALLADYGGRAQFDTMATWAAENLGAEEVSVLNQQLAAGGAQAKVALKSLQSLYNASVGGPGSLIDGNQVPGTVTAYRSIEEMVRDMQNPKYNEDPAFRDMVEAKLARSKL